MNKTIVIVIAVILVLGALGLFGFKAATKQSTSDKMQIPTGQTNNNSVSETISVPNQDFVLEEQNNSGQTGRVTLLDQSGKTRVVLSMDNSPADASQPAHIHAGSCPTPGAVKYPLNPVVDGLSDTILEVAYADLKTMVPLAVNVHKSAAEINSYIACTDLNF
jgi:cytoskeletal protein RodZ